MSSMSVRSESVVTFSSKTQLYIIYSLFQNWLYANCALVLVNNCPKAHSKLDFWVSRSAVCSFQFKFIANGRLIMSVKNNNYFQIQLYSYFP